MFDEYLVNNQIDDLTGFQCEDCGKYLSGGLYGEYECKNCDISYTSETRIVFREGVTN